MPVRSAARRQSSLRSGRASTASDCGVASQRALENTDGDMFSWAATGAELAPLFRVAIAQVVESIRFLKMPG